MTDRTLSRSERLRTLGAIRRLFESGEGGFVYPLRYLFFAESDTRNSVRVLFSTPKRYHKRANKRNLLRRRMKECYRLRKAALHFEQGVSLDLALIYSAKERVDYRRIDSAVEKILRKVSEQISAR
ncbi:ribonuclease P protein component [uncultured Alistipes sp.]|uniref:ribonuclease P protein component n=1 Tax=uncultured Alistipes sp. TaxID=538949 RepID=UPI0025E63486|nr:ribonuclease P protein component [uncultured Alistipes sp.]